VFPVCWLYCICCHQTGVSCRLAVMYMQPTNRCFLYAGSTVYAATKQVFPVCW
jgi:hypothetical protein